MKKLNMKTGLSVALAAASLLAVGGVPAFAAGSVPTGTLTSVKPRQNNAVSAGAPLSAASKGVKVFGADNTATLVKDELGTAPTYGTLNSIEIGGLTVGASPSCYVMVFDSSVAADTTESGAVSRMLVPPLYATVSGNVSKEFIYPKQFNSGLVVLTAGSGCRASIGWSKAGGSN